MTTDDLINYVDARGGEWVPVVARDADGNKHFFKASDHGGHIIRHKMLVDNVMSGEEGISEDVLRHQYRDIIWDVVAP